MIVKSKGAKLRFRKAVGFILLLLPIALIFYGIAHLYQLSYSTGEELTDFSQEKIPQLELIIPPASLRQLNIKRQAAIKSKVLLSGPEDLVLAKLLIDRQPHDVKIRLKGDWTDHIKGEKWSFRVILPNGVFWNGMQTFSLQSPETRFYINEWIFHQLLDSAGVLTTKYEFCHLRINGKSKGLYVFEEHFAKQLVESKKRREGPIMKFSEDGLWNGRYLNRNANVAKVPNSVAYNSAEITTFKAGRTLKDSVLSQEFTCAKNLLYQFKYDLSPGSQIVDAEIYGKFLAIIDLTRTYHGCIWHNLRFYYNPVTCKLEPIGFDGDTGHDFRGKMKIPPMAFHKKIWEIQEIKKPLKDPVVMNAYLKFMKHYSSSAFIEEFLGNRSEELSLYTALLDREFGDYKFTLDDFRANAAFLNAQMLEKQPK